ncbi:MAG: NUDIX hydrolase [Mycobacteriaceae bacterium]|nr:NUDIX hydrolase [Mycobacteriaceae bacterium]
MADHQFETESSDTAYRGRILALRVDHVQMPGGDTAIREVVEHYGAVAIAALDDDNRVPLIYQYRHPLGRRLWELPAGLLDNTSEDPLTTAQRELTEETGLAAAQWRVLIDVASSPGFTDESVRVYLAHALTDVGRPEGHDEEADLTVHWFDIEEAVQMVLRGEVVNATAAAGILAAHAATVDREPTRAPDAPWPDRPTAFARRQAQR